MIMGQAYGLWIRSNSNDESFLIHQKALCDLNRIFDGLSICNANNGKLNMNYLVRK